MVNLTERNIKKQLSSIYDQYINDVRNIDFSRQLSRQDSLIELSEGEIVKLYSLQTLIRPLYGKGSPQIPQIGDHPDFLEIKGTDKKIYCAITTMFMDIVSSTRLSLFYSLEEVQLIKNAFIRATIELIKCFDGHVHRIMGDAVMAYFGGKNIQEEIGIIDGLNCASVLRYFVESVVSVGLENRGFQENFGIRIGLDFGEKEDVLWTSYGYPGMDEVTATSFYVDVASKLQHAAGKNKIMIGQSLRDYLDIPDDLLKIKTIKKNGAEMEVYYLTPNYTDKDNKLINYRQYIFDWEKYLQFSPVSQENYMMNDNNSQIKNIQVTVKVYCSRDSKIQETTYYTCSNFINKHKELKFIISLQSLIHLRPYRVKFIVQNHGKEAQELGGDNLGNHNESYLIQENDNTSYLEHWETTLYRGLHYMIIELSNHKGLQRRTKLGIYVQ
ncbi:adenylate/guanylate cyclase domain-containing protein [Crocosphaera sp.]|uniref:nucleotide-binding domain-containing protein n=1 Tax=Crocosphaera sp. TaxID=2729996 RepID=UPI002606CE0C|nr:adenylate/guanylate cyclase domain-containing protein [Crocosphaera sp.]MDJ0583288.1 adenylate/guanylate cyclase domain-containing protein [Crocosphaera sp.]